MQSDPVDIVSLLIAALALIASKEIASMIGPYAAIVVLACTGAAISLSGTEQEMDKWWKPILYVGIRVMLAVSLTVAIAELLQNVIPWAKPRYTLIVLALGIGAIGDFRSVRAWIADIIDKWTRKRIDDGK